MDEQKPRNERANRNPRAWETAIAAQRRAELDELEANWRESVRTTEHSDA